MNIQGFTPAMTAPMAAQAASSQSASGSSGSVGNTALSSGNLESTFLSLLVTELQNQDPTSPVNPTQMVSQMVSLNQLDQLISINQTLSTMSGTGAAPPPSGTKQPALSPAPARAAISKPASGATDPLALMAPGASFPAQSAVANGAIPGGLMNLYGTIAAPANSFTHAATGGR